MKQKMVILILIIGIVLISGCTSEEKTNSKSSIDSQSSEPLIKPSDLPKGYLISDYTTYAISKGDFVDINYSSLISNSKIFSAYADSDNEYEGDIPEGKKRILTTFIAAKEDKSNITVIFIQELDSNSGLEEIFSTMESICTEGGVELKTNFVGDNSIMIQNSSLWFTSKNYLVYIYSGYSDASGNGGMYGDEIIEVAKAIEKGLN
jgi:hypothetical protein